MAARGPIVFQDISITNAYLAGIVLPTILALYQRKSLPLMSWHQLQLPFSICAGYADEMLRYAQYPTVEAMLPLLSTTIPHNARRLIQDPLAS